MKNKYLVVKICDEKFVISVIDILHIISRSAMLKFESDMKDIVGTIAVGDIKFYCLDLRKKIRSDCDENSANILVINSSYLDEVHYEKVTKKIPIGYIVDKLENIIEVDQEKKINDIDIVNWENNIYPIVNFEDYLDISVVESIRSLMKRDVEQKLKISNKNKLSSDYDNIYKKNKIIDIWKSKHKTE